MADDSNPFTRLFEPAGIQSQAGVFDPFGFVGRLAGLPSTQERLGGLQGTVAKELSDEVTSNGGNPQQAIMKVIQGTNGQALFSSGDPNAMKVFSDFVKTVQPPPPTQVHTAPGANTEVLDPYNPSKVVRSISQPSLEAQNPNRWSMGSVSPGSTGVPVNARTGETGKPIAVPPADVQSFLTMAEKGQLAPERFKQLAEGYIAKDMIVMHEARGGPDNEVLGWFVYDKSQPNAPPKYMPSMNAPAPAPVPGSKVSGDGSPKPGAEPQPQVAGGAPGTTPGPRMVGAVGAGPTGMFSATGLGAAIQQSVSGTVERVSPKASTPESRQMDRNVADAKVFYQSAQSLVDSKTQLGVPKALLAAIEPLVLDPGWFSAPETKKLADVITLRKQLENEYAADYAVWKGSPRDYSKTARHEAEQRVTAYSRVLKTIPTGDEMEQRLAEFTEGKMPGGVVGAVAPAARSVKELGVEGTKQVIKEVGAAFKGTPAAPAQTQAPAAQTNAPTGPALPKLTPEQTTNIPPAIIPRMDAATLDRLDPETVKANPALQQAYIARIRELMDAPQSRQATPSGRRAPPTVGAPRPRGPVVPSGEE